MDLITQLNTYMASMGVDYAICGGHAIDLFLGYKARPHKDLDVAVFGEDRDTIVRHMLDDGWALYEPCGGAYLHKINRVDDQKRLRTNIWCLKPDNPHYRFTEHENDMYAVVFDDTEQTDLDYIELLFNTRQNGHFVYSRNHDIKRAYGLAILKAEGMPYLAPEIVLLYKSTAADNPDYQFDYATASPGMSADQSAWLKSALAAMYPSGHTWL